MLSHVIKRFPFVFSIIAVVAIGCTRNKTPIQPNVSSDLPSLFITVPSEQLDIIHNDKESKVPGQALLITSDQDTLYDGNLTYIKTRGNTTWSSTKKPYNIKFPRKQRFLDLYASKSFVLLANSMDESHIRNAIAFDLAHAIGLPAPRYTFISLYINGEYKGLYQMTNKVGVGKHTLNITDLDKLNKQENPLPTDSYTWFGYGRKKGIIQRKGMLLENDPEDITGGYLLDNSGMDWIYRKSESGFVSDSGDPIRIHSPKYASLNEVEYIANLYNQMEAAIMSDDGYNPQTGKHYSEYIDVESFARYYLLNELLLNQDGGFVSFFMYKDADVFDSKIYAGPIWDFDKSLMSPSCNNEIIVYNEIYVGSEIGKIHIEAGRIDEPHSGGLLYHLTQHDDFQCVVKNNYYNEISPICHDYIANGKIDILSNALYHEAEKDNHLYTWLRKSSDYFAATNAAKDFLESRLKFLDWYFSASENDMICIEYKSENKKPHERKIHIYYPTNEPVHPPLHVKSHSGSYKHLPVFELYLYGTDSIITDGTIFHSPQLLELREREPTWKEVQLRRIQKNLGKWK